MATLNLVKGEKIDLTKAHAGLAVICIGGGWDINAQAENAGNYDLDIFAVGLDAAKKPISGLVTFFGQKNGIPGVELDKDNLTGEGDGDDETITVKLAEIPSTVDSIVFAINIYSAKARNQRFGMVQNSFVRVYNQTNNEELAKFDLGEDYGAKTGVIAAKLYRHNGEWKFEAIGEGVDGDINEIIAQIAQ